MANDSRREVLDAPIAASGLSARMLPISVLVPTRNSMSLLPQHIESMRAWLGLVQEVVAVDSHSTDGTLELLQHEFGTSGRVLTHPPGLYQSWNFGLAQCRAKYVYISTVGDPISRVGIEKLCATIEEFRADVAISPPRMVDTDGRTVDKVWPVHSLIESWNLQSPVVMDGADTHLFALIHLRRGILGSSASNLYRAEVLHRAPFRTDFGTAGDLAWGLEHAAGIRLAVLPEQVSSFVFHPKSYAKSDYAVDDFAGRCLALARASTPPAWAGHHQMLDSWRRFLAGRDAVAAAKKAALWFLDPRSWLAHRERAAAFRELTEMQRNAMESIRPRVCTSNSALPS